MHHLRFRQVHLDFHTSPLIPAIGSQFNKKEWQERLKAGYVNSITCFATCHHGMSYYDTKIGFKHPNLKIDLLRAQYEASKEIDVNVPIYLTGGVHNYAMTEHPEWRAVDSEGRYAGWARTNLEPGFFHVCFNTPYLDYLCSQIEEVVRLFPECDGIFIDIISQPQCCCHRCIAGMKKRGLDPQNENDRKIFANEVLLNYYRRATAAARSGKNKQMPIFHNSGNVATDNRGILPYFSHLELESLPTGGWGYDHFPMSAKYCQTLPHDFLGMTGKFHTTWGEFGGFKHPNALRYECAAMLAVGAKCSVGDQLHPVAKLDRSTYEIIGAAYREVAAKEAWCDNAAPVNDLAILSTERDYGHNSAADNGAGRILLENHMQFAVIDRDSKFDGYKALILPDDVQIDKKLQSKLDAYLKKGGKLIMSHKSGLNAELNKFLFPFAAKASGMGVSQPDYILPAKAFRPEFLSTPMVMYAAPVRLKPGKGATGLGACYDSYFNRAYDHFSSHQHTPNRPADNGFACGAYGKNILYFAHPVFSLYFGYGNVILKNYIATAIREFLKGDLSVESNLPSTARLHIMEQPKEKRYIVHLLYANTISRGAPMQLSGGTVCTNRAIEVIEELLPLNDVEVAVTLPKKIKKATLEPQGTEIPFTVSAGRIKFTVDQFTCHQMVVLSYR